MLQIESPYKSKQDALSFLHELEDLLNAKLPPSTIMKKAVRDIVASSRNKTLPKHLRSPEAAFLRRYVIPNVFEFLQARSMQKEDARKALLAEGFLNSDLKQYCSGSPARAERHPFSKLINSTSTEIVRKWRGKSPLTGPCPDLALRSPFKIVFEGKYFEQGSPDKAGRDLVTNIYQAFFYRALPYVEAKANGIAWDYDFACLLAYDASRNATLYNAWHSLLQQTKDAFWNGANVFVMILRGNELLSQESPTSV
jgi:hypothetical protein